MRKHTKKYSPEELEVRTKRIQAAHAAVPHENLVRDGKRVSSLPQSKAALKTFYTNKEHQKYASHFARHIRNGLAKVGCRYCINPDEKPVVYAEFSAQE
jgi:hypothetical protein